MEIIKYPKELQSLVAQWREAGFAVSLVPTMGYFHSGHESLMKAARDKGQKVIVSRFVNPTQFGPSEDLAAYPSDVEGDIAVATKMGVDVLFMPDTHAMYGTNHATWVQVGTLSETLCGASRPIHFRGVCTVVTMLFAIAQPHYAFFGEKDWQQLAIIRRMVRDLHFPVEIIGMPIVREADGLALSSRNAYLTPSERAEAPSLAKGLTQAKKQYQNGERAVARLRAGILEYWKGFFPSGRVDYLEFVNPESLESYTETIDGPVLVATAVHVGKARLIDNCLLSK